MSAGFETFQICMRSRRSVLKRRSDSSIDATTSSRPPEPRTDTFVAMKYLSRFLSSASRSPTTLSARPYDGAVSSTLPPSSGKSRSVSRSGGRSSGFGF